MLRYALGADEILYRSLKVQTVLIQHFTYLFVDLGCLLVPLLYSPHPRIRFDRELKHCFIPALVTALLFIVWDIIFTEHGVWSFNPDYVLGIYVFNLPLEEILFFLCIPYACVFTYFCVRKFAPSLQNKKIGSFAPVAGVMLLVVAVLNYDRLYTFATFLLCGIALVVAGLRFRKYITVFFVAYALVFPFFLLSNGILTGTFLQAPVVAYNNQENLGIRLLTIPVEDIAYGMLLILLNVVGYETVRALRRSDLQPAKKAL